MRRRARFILASMMLGVLLLGWVALAKEIRARAFGRPGGHQQGRQDLGAPRLGLYRR